MEYRNCFHYFLFGVELRSNLAMPGLAETSAPRSAEIEVRFHEQPSAWRERRHRAETLRYRSASLDGLSRPEVQVWDLDGDCFRFLYRDGTEFFVDRLGRRIWADWPPTSTVEDTLTYLLGTIMAFALHRQGMTCLHASAVEVDGAAIALCGPGGAGKSTTAALFSRHGFRVLSDDVLILDEAAEGFVVRPSYPVVRLWPDSVRLLYGSAEALPPLTPNWDKRGLQLAERANRFQDRPLPLGAVYVLGARDDRRKAPSIENAAGADGLVALIANDHLARVMDKTELARSFERLCRLRSRVPLRRIAAPADPERLSELPSAIVDDFRKHRRV